MRPNTESIERIGNSGNIDVERNNDRQESACDKSGRRSTRLYLVKEEVRNVENRQITDKDRRRRSVSFENGIVTVKGKLGTLTQAIENEHIKVKVEDGMVHVTRDNEIKSTKAAHGLYRALIANMMTGVTQGFKKGLVIAGVGYKAQMKGKDIVLNVGYSHPVNVEAPEGITFECPSITEITVKGISKELVGQTAANIKAIRKPEPYHGYGIHYSDETILRKEGKTNGK